jgi:hypothetical protein
MVVLYDLKSLTKKLCIHLRTHEYTWARPWPEPLFTQSTLWIFLLSKYPIALDSIWSTYDAGGARAARQGEWPNHQPMRHVPIALPTSRRSSPICGSLPRSTHLEVEDLPGD